MPALIATLLPSYPIGPSHTRSLGGSHPGIRIPNPEAGVQGERTTARPPVKITQIPDLTPIVITPGPSDLTTVGTSSCIGSNRRVRRVAEAFLAPPPSLAFYRPVSADVVSAISCRRDRLSAQHTLHPPHTDPPASFSRALRSTSHKAHHPNASYSAPSLPTVRGEDDDDDGQKNKNDHHLVSSAPNHQQLVISCARASSTGVLLMSDSSVTRLRTTSQNTGIAQVRCGALARPLSRSHHPQPVCKYSGRPSVIGQRLPPFSAEKHRAMTKHPGQGGGFPHHLSNACIPTTTHALFIGSAPAATTKADKRERHPRRFPLGNPRRRMRRFRQVDGARAADSTLPPSVIGSSVDMHVRTGSPCSG